MTKDRLAELRRIRGHNDAGSDDDEADGGRGDPPSYQDAVVIQMDRFDGLSGFFKQVEDTRKMIEELKEDVLKVRKLHSKILSSPIPDEKVKQELDQLMSTVKTSSNVIRTKLKDIERAVQKEEEDSVGNENTSANLRMRRNQHSALLRTFIDTINDYQQAQTDYRDRCKTRIKRQLEIAGSQFTDDEVEHMIEDGNWGVFTQGIIQETEQARQMLAEIEARHNDIIKLEKSIKELHELFVEMAVLVQSQGEVIDRIETHVTSTRDYVEEGRVQLQAAQKSQTAARKKKIYIIIIVLVILLILGLIIYFTV